MEHRRESPIPFKRLSIEGRMQKAGEREKKVNRGQGQVDCIREKYVLIRAQEEGNQTKLIKLGVK